MRHLTHVDDTLYVIGGCKMSDSFGFFCVAARVPYMRYQEGPIQVKESWRYFLTLTSTNQMSVATDQWALLDHQPSWLTWRVYSILRISRKMILESGSIVDLIKSCMRPGKHQRGSYSLNEYPTAVLHR